ncbi:MAG TPA: ABC transporter ATP-binding protein [Firmicutes bacterium]|nr:ABC transporter ATP-binding protein [Bacillota bacterium]
MKHIRWIWSFWQPHRPWLFVLAALTLLSSAVTLAFPKVLGYVIDSVQRMLEANTEELASSDAWRLILVIVAIGLARTLSNLYPGTRAMLNARIEMDVRQTYFGKIINKGFRFFNRFRTGDLVTRLTDDIGGFPKIAWFSCSGVFRAVESSSKFLFCLAIMLAMSWKLALLAIAPLPVMLLLFYRVRMSLTKRSLERQAIISTTNDSLEAAFSGVRILKAFCGEPHQGNEFRKLLNRRIGVELSWMKLWMAVHNIYMGIQFLGQIIVVIAGGLMVLRGTLSVGDFYAFYVYVTLMLPPLMDIPNLFVTSRQAFACIDREIEIEETSGGTEEIYTGTAPVPAVTSLEIRHASFSYGEELALTISNLDLRVNQGEKVAIVGLVGSGKSTLLKMAAGLLPPTAGSVLVNGRPLSDLSLSQFRARVGYIPQEPTLFSESVAENVRFGRDLEQPAVVAGLKLAQLHDEMARLPDGLDQVLGQKGLTISGGQKQRLAIARAVAHQPDLLLMDDCTSALDAENEVAFWREFSRLCPDTACLIVTHRLATARQADRICVLDQGRLVAEGSHAELIDGCAEYRKFLTTEELQEALQSA